ncbi:MAG: hypothetical protein K2G88_01220, partial [Oscillospiraceae bacterium]|nr:hypothetical protein [Oscillospiraceae bacterium]
MTIENLTREDRLNIYRAIEYTGIFEVFRQNGTFASFIASFEDIHDKPSSDSRFRTFYEDIVQHCQNNDDYSSDEVLLSKINVLDDSFKKFLISCLDSNWYGADIALLTEVKKVLEERLGYFNLIIESQRLPSGIVVWNIKEGDNRYTLADVKPNDIPIYLDSNPDYPTNRIGNHKKPETYPAIVLAFDKFWDDYSVHFQFDVFFHLNEKKTHYVGKTRIMAEDKLINDHDVDKLVITEFFKDHVFLALPDGFCSLGKNEDYYRSLNLSLESEEKTRSLLWALKDVGLFSTLQEKFENQKLWSYMTHEKTSQHMLRYAYKALIGQKYGNDYGFTYRFRPPYSYKDSETLGNTDPRIEITFNFNQKRIWPSRLYALIGKNGCGKTRLLSSIPRSLSWRTPDDFKGVIPVFGKIIAVSNSHYDNFDIPQTRADFNYVYCGLSEIKEGVRQSLGLDYIIDIIFSNCEKANKQLRESLK